MSCPWPTLCCRLRALGALPKHQTTIFCSITIKHMGPLVQVDSHTLIPVQGVKLKGQISFSYYEVLAKGWACLHETQHHGCIGDGTCKDGDAVERPARAHHSRRRHTAHRRLYANAAAEVRRHPPCTPQLYIKEPAFAQPFSSMKSIILIGTFFLAHTPLSR